MRSTIRLQRHRKVLCLYPFRKRRIHHGCAAMRVRFKQPCRNGCAAIGREQPQLIDLLRRQWRQITGEENQAPIVPLVDRLTSWLRLVAGGNQFDLLRFRIDQCRDNLIGLLQFGFVFIKYVSD